MCTFISINVKKKSVHVFVPNNLIKVKQLNLIKSNYNM